MAFYLSQLPGYSSRMMTPDVALLVSQALLIQV